MYAYNLLACSPTCGNGKQTSFEGAYHYCSTVRVGCLNTGEHASIC